MLHRALERQGVNHRRWRVVFVLLLAPFAVYAFMYSGWMTTRLGQLTEQRWDMLCLVLAFAGLALRMHMAGYGQVAEAGQLLQQGPLQTEGLYSVVRHPVVLANFLILLSGTLLFKSAFFTMLVVIVACLYYERLILAKEKALLERHGDAYAAWEAATPLILPRLSLWKKPSAPFLFARALRREAITFAFIGLMFFVLETLEGAWIDGLPFMEWAQREPHWLGLFSVSAVIFAAQLSRVLAIVVLLTSLIGFAAAHVGGFTSARSNSEDRAFEALKAGGHVLLMRHSFTSGRDEEDLSLDDCATQRNLSEQGRDHARVLGRMLLEGGVRIAKTITSQFCRTKETAHLMGHDPEETIANLNEQRTHVTLGERLFGNNENDERIFRHVRNIVGGWDGKDNLLLVSHAPIIAGLTYRSLHMGEGLVLKPAPHLALGFTIVGKIPNNLSAARH
jgi:protein-S-isoprenylcysteine O-methyltransferase Ste14/phosphohistidine phosphatase SixA